MDDDELRVFTRYCAASREIVEFGLGGSTIFAVSNTQARIRSVESDPAWIAKLREDPVIFAAERNERLMLIHVDIGPTKRWGRPADKSRRLSWPLYPAAPWPLGRSPDFVLVDGRFRLACILTAVLRTRPGTIIMVHDFWNRPTYHAALPFLNWIESAQTLAVFKRPLFVNRRAAHRLLQRVQYVPD
jgi:hypothetical protein